MVVSATSTPLINIKWAGNVQRGETHQLIGEAKASQNKVLLKRKKQKGA